MKKLISIILVIVFCFSILLSAFAEGIQNENGVSYSQDQLGYFGTDAFIYTEDPFTNLHAEDKGLIPYGKENEYKSPSWWAKSEILTAGKMGLLNMATITDYQGNITREEWAKLIMLSWHKYSDQSSKQLPASMPNYFKDISIPEDEAITEAYYLGIVQGRGNNIFDPETKIPRQELALMLLRYIALFDPNVIGTNDVNSRFTDTDEIAVWAKKECIVIGNLEIMIGDNKSRFMPLDFTTNEQAAIVMLRVAEKWTDNQVENNLIAPTANYNEDYNNTKITWNAIASATRYRVGIYKYQSKTEKTKSSHEFTHTTSLDLKGIESGTYGVKIMSLNEFNNSVESDELVVYVPNAVTNVELSENTLSWNNSNYKKLPNWNNSNQDVKYKVEVIREDEIVNKFDNVDTTTFTFPDGLIQEGDIVKVYGKWFGFESASTEIIVPTP